MEKTLAQIKARDIMSRHVVSINPDDTVQEAMALLQENLYSTLPITNGASKVVGIIAAREILQWSEELDDGVAELMEVSDYYRDVMVNQAGEKGAATKVSELMNDQVVVADENASLAEVVSILLRNSIHHLPIVDGKERMVGFVSTTDVLRAISEKMASLTAT